MQHNINLTEEAENVYKYRQTSQDDFNFSKFVSDALLDDVGYLSPEQITTKIARMKNDREVLKEDISSWESKLSYAKQRATEQGRDDEQIKANAIAILRTNLHNQDRLETFAASWAKVLKNKYTSEQLIQEAKDEEKNE